MAANLQLLKRRINTSKNIAQIAKAMETISASKIKKAQDAANGNKPYAQKILELAAKCMDQLKDKKFSHPYMKLPKNKSKLYVVITPDKGLCGALNTNLYKKMLEVDSNNAIYIVLGKKAEQFSTKLLGNVHASFKMGTSLSGYSTVIQVKSLLDNLLKTAKISEAYLLYAEFDSILTQLPVVKKLLPLNLEIIGARSEKDGFPGGNETLFEPNAEDFLMELLPKYIETQIFNALIQAFTSEQAARMMAMQNAKNNAFDIAEYLTLSYNKSRQERITNEILDLTNSQF